MFYAVQVDCQDGDLRLVGGRNEQEGNLQVCINGVWGSVSQRRRRFNFTEASVACNQLGYNPTGTTSMNGRTLHLIGVNIIMIIYMQEH